MFGVVGVEVVLDQGQHFGTVRGKLDKFSTFLGLEVRNAARRSRQPAEDN
jgi:hypothetical protein